MVHFICALFYFLHTFPFLFITALGCMQQHCSRCARTHAKLPVGFRFTVYLSSKRKIYQLDFVIGKRACPSPKQKVPCCVAVFILIVSPRLIALTPSGPLNLGLDYFVATDDVQIQLKDCISSSAFNQTLRPSYSKTDTFISTHACVFVYVYVCIRGCLLESPAFVNSLQRTNCKFLLTAAEFWKLNFSQPHFRLHSWGVAPLIELFFVCVS